jgi:hypothetical protein
VRRRKLISVYLLLLDTDLLEHHIHAQSLWKLHGLPDDISKYLRDYH